jgi:archaellum component FlaC
MRKDKKYDELKDRISKLEDELQRFAAIVGPDIYHIENDIEDIQEKLEKLEQAINGFGYYY